MSIDKVRSYFKPYGIEDRIQEFEVSSATVTLAAAALGCEEKCIAKSLTFLVGGEPILVVAAGDAKVDNGKFKSTFHTKAKMLSKEQVEEFVGYSVGGVCPFGVNEGVKIYLDESIKRFDFVYPACGTSNSAIKLSLGELEEVSHREAWVDVCKEWEGL